MSHDVRCDLPRIRWRDREGTLWMCITCRLTYVVTWTGGWGESWRVWERV